MDRDNEVTLSVVFINDVNHGITAFFKEFDDIVAQGKTIEEAKKNLIAALKVKIQSGREDNENKPLDFDNNFEKSEDELRLSIC